jgi:hypothetical protein
VTCASSLYHLWLGHAYSRQLSTAGFLRKPFIARRSGEAYDMAVKLDPTSIDAAEARLAFFLGAPGIVGGGVDKARAEARAWQRWTPVAAPWPKPVSRSTKGRGQRPSGVTVR